MNSLDDNSLDRVQLQFSYLKLWLLFALSLSFYVFFICTNSFFHSFNQNISLSNITPWAKGSVVLEKGIELYEMFICMPLFLVIAYLISTSKRFDSSYFQKTYILLVYSALILGIWGYYVFYYEEIDTLSVGFFIGGTILVYILHFIIYVKIPGFISSLLLILIVFLLSFTINGQASVFDYGFIIGPAKKIMQGEKIGTFYMQYNVLITLIITSFLKLKLLLNEMQIVLHLIFALWFLMYKKIADKLFQHKSMVYFFIVALLIARGFALTYYGGPISSPQNGPWRIDLWVPIVLVLLHFGFKSIITAIAFSLIYLLDDIFGFMYLLLYIVSLLLIYANNTKNGYKISLSKNLIPIIIAVILHFLVFKSIMSPAGGLYSSYNFCLIPIAINSTFWLLVLILPPCLYILIKKSENREFSLFLFGIVCIQLLYFFGRSHDNNLRHLSGIFVFIIFLSIDSLYSYTNSKKMFILYVSLLIGFMCYNYNIAIYNAYLVFNDIKEHGLSRENTIDIQIKKDADFFKTLDTKKIIQISQYEPYSNYRLGYNQTGYFSPIIANLFCDQNVSFLYNAIKNNYRIIVIKDSPLITVNCINFPACIDVFNKTPIMKKKQEQFKLDSLYNQYSELTLIPLKSIQ